MERLGVVLNAILFWGFVAFFALWLVVWLWLCWCAGEGTEDGW